MPAETIELPQEFEEEKSKEGALVLRESGEIVKIADQQSYLHVCSKVKEAAANIKSIEAYMEPFILVAHARHKKLTQKRAELLAPFEQAKTKLSALVFNFQVEQEEIRKREEEKARAEALRQQEADQAAQAEQLAAEDRLEEGVHLLETAITEFIPAAVASTVPRVKGISQASEKYIGEVTNMKAFVQGIAEGKTPLNLIKVDQSALDKLCGVYRESMAFPGVTLKKRIGGSVRG
jgi:hypothetical protein